MTNYENYSISTMENVRNDNTNKILQPEINTNGYYHVNASKNNKYKIIKYTD